MLTVIASRMLRPANGRSIYPYQTFREAPVLVVVAALIVVGLLCLLDLLVTFGVIRRLRQHAELLRDHQMPADHPVIGLATGQAPEPFTTVTADGSAVVGPAGLRLVGFFSAGCSACPERVAPFAAYLRTSHIAREEALAVLLVAEDMAPPAYLGTLAAVAQVSVQPLDSEVARAFAVSGYPAFCLLDGDGAVLTSGYDPATLPAPAMG